VIKSLDELTEMHARAILAKAEHEADEAQHRARHAKASADYAELLLARARRDGAVLS